MSPAPIGITGATGRLGGRVARALAADGLPLRLIVRDPGRAPELPAAGVARAAYDDPTALRAAFAGLDTLLFVSGAEAADRLAQHRTVVEAAVAAGVRHIVYTSVLGAAPDSTFTLARDHHATEQAITAAGLRSTFLRDSLYADFLPAMAGDDGVIRGPAGDGRVAPVTVDDVADCAAAVLRDPAPHAGRTYDLTGPAALMLTEIAEIITVVTGRPVRYLPETLDEAYASRAHYGAAPWQVDAWVSTYTAIGDGSLDLVSPDVERLSGHPATSVRAMLELGTAAY
ncbi:MAG: SDR family oxidoreductase [Jatrophihabitans sp.]|uniref:SDR family oxidoreductase n=1 Tax=Jatrophihabitans sp. TaxID=1932789 RepID=UPI003F80A263